METFLTKLSDKISHYEILNNLIPGSALCFILSYIGYPILDFNAWVCIVICYLVGIINGRVSSVIIEWLCRITHFIKWREYAFYNKARKERPFIVTLQENANMYRAFTSVFLIALCAYALMRLSTKWMWLSENGIWVLLIALLVLFALSYRKQTNEYIIKNIDEVVDETTISSKDE